MVNGGNLSIASMDIDLAAALGAAQLAIRHAVIFAPDGGTLAGKQFLIVDINGVAGYQAGGDLVILLDHAKHIGDLSLADFV